VGYAPEDPKRGLSSLPEHDLAFKGSDDHILTWSSPTGGIHFLFIFALTLNVMAGSQHFLATGVLLDVVVFSRWKPYENMERESQFMNVVLQI
jgi:hypothetical protein